MGCDWSENGHTVPNGQTGDDLCAAGSRQHRQKAFPVPFGDETGRGLPVPFVWDLHRVEPQRIFLVLNFSKPTTTTDSLSYQVSKIKNLCALD